VLISLGEIIVITLVGLIALKPSDIVPIMKWLGKIISNIKLKISTIISHIKHYFK
jgi:Sec-independent protein translocase protein TatA